MSDHEHDDEPTLDEVQAERAARRRREDLDDVVRDAKARSEPDLDEVAGNVRRRRAEEEQHERFALAVAGFRDDLALGEGQPADEYSPEGRAMTLAMLDAKFPTNGDLRRSRR